MSERTPDLGQVLRDALDTRLASMYVMRPGRIEKFDASTGLASVKPLLKEMRELDSGEVEVVSVPVVPSVPVFCFGGGDYMDTAPVAVGDTCLLLYSDRSLDIWKEQGGEVDPVDPRRHDQTDAVALVGLRAKAQKLAEWDANRRVIGKQGGPRVALDSTTVHLGVSHAENATEAFVKGNSYRNAEDTFFTDLVAQLTAAGASLQTAGATVAAAGTANTPPIVGGIASAPAWAAAAVSLTVAANALNLVASKLAVFSAGAAGYLSTIVKGK